VNEQVWSYSGQTYAERPTALRWEGERLEIVEILDRWHSPGEKGFRVRTSDSRVFKLVYDEPGEEWFVELISGPSQ
jgi:hypothetical protein